MDPIDFHCPRRPAPWWAWTLLAAGALAGAAAAMALWTGHRDTVEQAAEVARLTAAIERRVGAGRAATGASGGRTKARENMARQREQWVGRLHRPWLGLLDALEHCATPLVPLVQLSVDTGFQSAQLQVETDSLPQLFAYVTKLQQAGSPIRSAQLDGHEWTTEAAGSSERRLRGRIALRLDAGPGAVAAAAERGVQ